MKVLLLFFVCFMTYSCHSRNHSDSSEVSSDDTLFALIDGKVKFERVGRDRKQVSIYAVEQ